MAETLKNQKEKFFDKENMHIIIIAIIILLIGGYFTITTNSTAKPAPTKVSLNVVLTDASQGKIVSATLNPNNNEVVATAHDGSRYVAEFSVGQGDGIAQKLYDDHVKIFAFSPQVIKTTPPKINIPNSNDE